MSGTLQRFLHAIGYPEGVSDGAVAFTLLVDGASIDAREDPDRLLLVRELRPPTDAPERPDLLESLADYAAGRLLREEAILAYDPTRGAPILWQACPSVASDADLRRLFETFTASCDWWQERLNGPAAEPTSALFPELVIRP